MKIVKDKQGEITGLKETSETDSLIEKSVFEMLKKGIVPKTILAGLLDVIKLIIQVKGFQHLIKIGALSSIETINQHIIYFVLSNLNAKLSVIAIAETALVVLYIISILREIAKTIYQGFEEVKKSYAKFRNKTESNDEYNSNMIS